MLIGCMSPPIGDIPTSSIYGGGCFLVLCAAVCGMDIPGTLREIRLMRDGFVDKITEKQEDEENTQL